MYRLTLVVLLLVAASACSSSPTAPTAASTAALVITAQPQSQSVASGATATIRVTAVGADPVRYQWFQGTAGDATSPVAGATEPTFTTSPLTSTALYWVRVSGGGQTVDSMTATLRVEAVAPFITEEPEDATVAPGGTTELFVEVTGTSPMSFQWYRGGRGTTTDPMPGATSARLATPALTASERFWVRVANAAGRVDSHAALVTVVSPSSNPTPEPTAPHPAPTPAPTPSPAPAPAPAPTPAPPPAPTPAPPSGPDPTAVAYENEVLSLINQRRAAGATCGSTPYAPAAAVTMNGSLQAAARGHSADMAANSYVSHTSLDGRSFVDRIRAAGFTGPGPFGENIGAGQGSPAAIVAGWMNSPGHCQNIMNGAFRQAGVGYAFKSGSNYGSYWTLNLAGQ